MESPNCGLPTKIIKSFGLIVRADFSIIIDVYKQVCLHSYMTKQKANLIECKQHLYCGIFCLNSIVY